MAFVPWKDRVTETPHRYKFTQVSADTYDLEAVPGAIGEAGTPVNAANLNKLIQRDGDDIKDTVTTFTEASSRANIATGEKTSTIFGKIKKWFADLKPHAFNDLATAQGVETDKAPTNKLLNDTAALKVDKTSISTVMPLSSAAASNEKVLGEKVVYDEFAKKAPLANPTFTGSVIVPTTPSGPSAAVSKSYADSVGFARVYRSFADLGIPNSSTIAEIHAAMIDRSKALIPVSTYAHALYGNTGLELPNSYFYVLEAIRSDNERLTLKLVGKQSSSDVLYHYEAMYWNYGTTNKFTGWKRIINDEDGLSTPYDKVIRTQAEFNELIASPTWLGATSVALVGQFTLSTANNSGIKIPATVKQIHGFNSAKITITNFVYNSSTAKGGLWYDTLPTTLDYSICDLEVDCTGTDGSGRGFYNCTNLTNCTGKGTGEYGYGFFDCTKLTNCTGKGTGTSYGYGFYLCTNLTNCTGTGTATDGSGYGFHSIEYASNCRDGGSKTDMWGGINYNIDVETCRKTPVEANLTTLNT